jgi:hypothetical protein
MTDVRKTAYLAEAQTGLSTELNNLADDTWSAVSSEIDNSTNGYMFMDIEADLASITPTGADAAIELYVVPSVDGTQYPSTSNSGTADEQENNQYFVGSIVLSLDAEVQIHMLRGIEVPTGKWKMFVRNRSNVSLAASGSTIKWRPWGYQSA